MSLLLYRLDYSKLSPDEADTLFQHIEDVSFNGFHVDPYSKIGEFFLDESVDVATLRIPDSCHLRHLH